MNKKMSKKVVVKGSNKQVQEHVVPCPRGMMY